MQLFNEKESQTNEILKYYAGRTDQESVVEMLRELQDVHGFISPSVKEMAAQAAGVKVSLIQAIIKRIPSLKEAPYIHEIVFCTGKNCLAQGNMDLLGEVRKRLEVNEAGISKDQKVCVKTRSCLKQCRTSPNVMIDGCVYSGKNADWIMEVIKGKNEKV